MNRIVIIADDHTGAGDSGIHFAMAGRKVALLWDLEGVRGSLPSLSGIALSTESRFLDPDSAAGKVRAAIRLCSQAGFRRFFKKIDSTMRGNPGSEIEAALDATGCVAALVCTAMPKLGRTCVDGVVLLEGKLLHTTDIGQDPFHPLQTSSPADILARQTSLPIARLTLMELRSGEAVLETKLGEQLAAGCRIIVSDAETEADLRNLGDLLAKMPGLLPVGAGGLAEALARTLPGDTNGRSARSVPAGRMLAVVGSLAEASRAQADFACGSGSFHPLDLNPEEDPERERVRLADEAVRCKECHLLLRPRPAVRRETRDAAEGERVAEMLGRAAEALFRAVRCEILFSAGGSTSMAVARALGIELVTLEEEILPGVVLGSCVVPGLGKRWFVTKAGGFGDERTLVALADRFRTPADAGGTRP